MSTVITRPPSGLLDLVGTKAAGQNPDLFSGTAGLTVDGLWMLGLQRQEFVLGIAPSPLVQFTPTWTHTVPLGEAWILWGYTINVACGVATTLVCRPCIFNDDPTAGGSQAVKAGLSTTTSASNTNIAPMEIYHPIFLRAGWHLGLFTQTTSGTPTVTGVAWITRLQV